MRHLWLQPLQHVLSVISYSSPLSFCYTQTASYVNVRMKWKKDVFYDSVDVINNSKELRIIVSLKNIIACSPDSSIPISDVSKMGRILEVSGRVAAFLRKYPSFFEEFTGPQYNLPWFRLTPKAACLHQEENRVFHDCRPEILDRLRRLILMTPEKKLPLQIIQGMQWYLGLPEDFTKKVEEYSHLDGHRWFHLAEMGNDVKGLCATAIDDDEVIPLSVIQKNALKAIDRLSPPPAAIAFPLYPSKGVRLKRKIANWLEGFQKLPYLSPYKHPHPDDLDRSSDLSGKRVVGVLHELLCLFVDNSAERRKLLCLRKHLGLPQKFGEAFKRHPHIFYLHLKNKTCTVVLKEAYHGRLASAMESHPMLRVREKYVRLMRESEVILRNKRMRKPPPKLLLHQQQEPTTPASPVVFGHPLALARIHYSC